MNFTLNYVTLKGKIISDKEKYNNLIEDDMTQTIKLYFIDRVFFLSPTFKKKKKNV